MLQKEEMKEEMKEEKKDMTIDNYELLLDELSLPRFMLASEDRVNKRKSLIDNSMDD